MQYFIGETVQHIVDKHSVIGESGIFKIDQRLDAESRHVLPAVHEIDVICHQNQSETAGEIHDNQSVGERIHHIAAFAHKLQNVADRAQYAAEYYAVNKENAVAEAVADKDSAVKTNLSVAFQS